MNQDSPHTGFAQRLQDICSQRGVPDGRQRTTSVADRFAVSRETARLWFAGRVLPELPRMIEIADEFACSLDWLVMGRGQSASPEQATGVAESKAGHVVLSNQERALLGAIRNLNDRRRSALLTLLGN